MNSDELVSQKPRRIASSSYIEVRHSYAATEHTFISYNCDRSWLPVDTGWVVLEPVNADCRAESRSQSQR